MKQSSFGFITWLIAALLASSPGASGQTSFGRISGSVRDPGGVTAVANAKGHHYRHRLIPKAFAPR